MQTGRLPHADRLHAADRLADHRVAPAGKPLICFFFLIPFFMHLFQLLRRVVARPALLGLLLLAGAAGLPCHAQKHVPLVYRLTGPTLLQECDDQGQPGTLPLHTAPGKAEFSLVRPVKTARGYLIRFTRWARPAGFEADTRVAPPATPSLTSAATFYQADGTVKAVTSAQRSAFYDSYYFDLNYNAVTGLERYFLITAEELAVSAEPVPALFSPIAGSLVVPFKYRPQYGGNFTKDLTLSSMGGAVYHFKSASDLSLAGLLGIGVTIVTVTQQNTSPSITTTQDQSAMTFSLALLLQWQRLEFGVVGGWDVLGASSATWVYNKQPWIGGGIGVNLLRADNVTAKKASYNSGIGR